MYEELWFLRNVGVNLHFLISAYYEEIEPFL